MHSLFIDSATLKAEIKQRGFKTNDFSEEVGLGRHDLYNIYKGRPIQLQKLEKIASYLGKPVDYFLTPESKETLAAPATSPKSEPGQTTPYDPGLYRESFDVIHELLDKYQVTVRSTEVMAGIHEEVYQFALEQDPPAVNKAFADGIIRSAMKHSLMVDR